MAVFRVERTNNYTVMSNYHLRDKNLSLKAKGLLSLMLSLPEDWDCKGSSGPQNGAPDHVGIVERIENGVVYTIEGNSSDSCRQRSYNIGHYEIYGYGTPLYT